MSKRNWGLIESGETFESLVKTLVFFEDSGAALFGRRGRDGGQDVRSSDRACVFQAKYHQDGSASKAIADAKKEAEKIAGYRSPEHSRESQWNGVTHWRLVTNAAFNPTDHQRWGEEVVPPFRKQGLEADYWGRATLDALLVKHPEVDREYFQNALRSFLSLPEVKATLQQKEPFLRRKILEPFVGRDKEIQKIESFLESEHRFLLVHGAGGVGKTGLVVEAGERVAGKGAWQVLWANVASMKASGTWFEGMVREISTFLIVDEPEDHQILPVLAEQLWKRVGPAPKWKIAIIVRSPKDPVLKFLRGPGIKPSVDELPVSPLPPGDAELMCKHLIASGPLAKENDDWKSSAAKELAERFSCHPVWLTLAVHALETHGDLNQVPQSAENLADQYLEEVEKGQSDYAPETVRALLRWVAIVGTFNRENDTLVQLVARRAGFDNSDSALEAMARLVKRGALAQRGAHNRLVEVKPDLVRDHLLRSWLSVDVDFGAEPIKASGAAKLLAQEVLKVILGGSFNAVGQAILNSLARTEQDLRLSGQAVDVLGSFVEGLLGGIAAATPSTRISIAKALVELAAFRPNDTVSLSRAIRNSSCATERINGIFGERDVGQDDVLIELAWPVFHAAFGAQTTEVQEGVLTELCELVEAEARIEERGRKLPNDGKRAMGLIRDVLGGGPRFWSDFGNAALKVGICLLTQAAEHSPNSSRRRVLEALLIPAMLVERQQVWSDGYTICIQKRLIETGHPAWPAREALKGRVKNLLADDATPADSRAALWPLFAEAHHNVAQCHRRGSQKAQTRMRREMQDNLAWAHSVLSSRKNQLAELKAARNLWHWHVQFEKDAELLKAAKALEKLYMNNNLAAEFEFLLGQDDWKAREECAAQKAEELVGGGSEDIEAFWKRATAFFAEQELHQVFNVAWILGRRADESPGVQEFVKAVLAEASVSPRTDFAAIAAGGWVEERRKADATAAKTLAEELVEGCGSPPQRIELLVRFYGGLQKPKDLGNLSDDEYRFIRSQEQLFVAAARGSDFVSCVGWGINFDWNNLRTIVERVLDAMPDNQMFAGLNTLVKVLFRTVRNRKPEELPDNLGVWMLDRLIRIPNINKLGGDMEWHIGEVLERVGRAPLSWLPGALNLRRTMETQRGSGEALSRRMRISGFVKAIDEEGAITPEIEAAVGQLLNLVSDNGSVGFHLYKVLRDVDPHGRVVPKQVAQRFTEADSTDARLRLARIGGGFTMDSTAWRAIAKPVLMRANTADTEERWPLYSAIDNEIRSSWESPGEDPAIHTDAVDCQRLEGETDAIFRPFWEWRLEIAEDELHRQKESAKEERGE